jgi:hypothetical protein
MHNKKEYNKLRKLLKRDGFSEIPRKANHMCWKKDGIQVTIGRNIRSAVGVYKLTIKHWNTTKNNGQVKQN